MIGPVGQIGPTGQPGITGPAFKVASGSKGMSGYASKPIRKQYKWKPWFAWRPVTTITGKKIWWKNIYRSIGDTYTLRYKGWTWYYYADDFDILGIE